MERKNIWNLYSDEQISELKEINDKYKRCLDAGKTERECVELSVKYGKRCRLPGILKEIIKIRRNAEKREIKVYAVNMNKDACFI